MSSYRPFPPQPPPPQPAFAPPPPPNPNQPLPPPPNTNPYPQQQQHHGGAYGYGRMHPGASAHQPYGAPYNTAMGHQQLPPPPPPQQYQYQPQPPASAYNMPPPPPPLQHQQPQQLLPPQQPKVEPVYYSSSASQYPQQFNQQAAPQPPPPPPPPPSSPPPLPPSLPPPPPLPPSAQPPHPPLNDKERASGSGAHHHSNLKHSFPPRQQKGPSTAPMARGGSLAHHSNGPPVKVETEEERKIRKRREYEKQKQEEKRLQMMKESQAAMLQKTQMMSYGMKPHGSIAGSRLMDRKAGPFLSGDRIENRLKKPTTFLCKLKFRNELPDPTAQPKLLAMNTNKDRYTKYAITSLEKMHKPKLYLEPDLGIPLDLLDIRVYNPPGKCPPLAPEDEELLRDSDVVTPVKLDGIRRKDRPTDKGVSWLVKTQYISPLSMDSAKLSMTEKQAKEMRETREGRNLFLENLNSRERQIQAIEESFKASKLRPVHQTNPELEPVEIFPLLPDLDRYDDQFVMVSFDGNPTAESEMFNKLDRSVRDDHESQAIMKSYVVNGSDPAKPEKFIAYMVPSPDELSKDVYDENEDISYSWIREYHWDVRGDDANDPTTYLVNFDDDGARYLPLPTKLVLQRRRAKEGRSGDDIEQFPVPSRVTVRRRSTVAVVEVESGRGNLSIHDYGSSKGNLKRARSMDDDSEMQHKISRMEEMDQYSGEEDMSD